MFWIKLVLKISKKCQNLCQYQSGNTCTLWYSTPLRSSLPISLTEQVRDRWQVQLWACIVAVTTATVAEFKTKYTSHFKVQGFSWTATLAPNWPFHAPNVWARTVHRYHVEPRNCLAPSLNNHLAGFIHVYIEVMQRVVSRYLCEDMRQCGGGEPSRSARLRCPITASVSF